MQKILSTLAVFFLFLSPSISLAQRGRQVVLEVTNSSERQLVLNQITERSSSYSQVGNVFGSSFGQRYSRVCIAPCRIAVAAGDYELGLSIESGAPIRSRMIRLDGRIRLDLEYESRGAVRAGGLAFTLLAVLGGAGAGAAYGFGSRGDSYNREMIEAGLIGMVASGVVLFFVALPMSFLQDHVEMGVIRF